MKNSQYSYFNILLENVHVAPTYKDVERSLNAASWTPL